MSVHSSVSLAEAADRLALRELFDAYAHCADRRDAEGQMALFAPDARFAVYMSGEGSEPTYVLDGREALSPVFADLNQYDVTTHFNGQCTVTLDGDTAAGECYTIAHHLYTADGERNARPRHVRREIPQRLLPVIAHAGEHRSTVGNQRERRDERSREHRICGEQHQRRAEQRRAACRHDREGWPKPRTRSGEAAATRATGRRRRWLGWTLRPPRR